MYTPLVDTASLFLLMTAGTLGSYFRITSCQKAWKIQNDSQVTRFHQNHNKGIGIGYACPESDRKYAVKAASEQSFESESGDYGQKNIWQAVTGALDSFYSFSRPHTVKLILL